MHRLGRTKYEVIFFAGLLSLAVIVDRSHDFYRNRFIVALRSERVMVVGDMEALIFGGGDEIIRPIPPRVEERIVGALALVETVRFPRSPKRITFDYLDVSEKIFSGISRLMTVKSLTFHKCTVDNGSLSRLCQLPRLEEVHITLCNLSDDGLNELTCIKGLKTLALHEAHITSEGIEKFRAVRPDVKIDLFPL